MITKATVSLYPQAGDRRPSPWPGGGDTTLPLSRVPEEGQAGQTGKGPGNGAYRGGNSYRKGQVGTEAGKGPAGH